jgi:hypothetical protein
MAIRIKARLILKDYILLYVPLQVLHTWRKLVYYFLLAISLYMKLCGLLQTTINIKIVNLNNYKPKKNNLMYYRKYPCALPSHHEGIRRGVDMKFHFSWTLELGTGYLHALSTLHLKKRLLYPLDRRLDWFQRRRSLCEAGKNYCPAWNRTLVVKSAFSLLGGLWLLTWHSSRHVWLCHENGN